MLSKTSQKNIYTSKEKVRKKLWDWKEIRRPVSVPFIAWKPG